MLVITMEEGFDEEQVGYRKGKGSKYGIEMLSLIGGHYLKKIVEIYACAL